MTGGAGIGVILPSLVYARHAFGERNDALFPQEEAVVARAVPSRRSEFRTARSCAREALAALGISAVPIPRGQYGEPCWPSGVVGSITHCTGYRAAAVALEADFASIGIDAEPDESLPDDVFAEVVTPTEARLLADRAGTATDQGRLLFCAKEATYKALFPLTGRWLEFHDIEISLGGTGYFRSQVVGRNCGVPDDLAGRLRGRWTRVHGLLLAAVVVRA